jgi:hypothetical protein
MVAGEERGLITYSGGIGNLSKFKRYCIEKESGKA